MKIDEIVYKLNYEIEKEYGIKNAIHTIIMNHKSFDNIVINMYRDSDIDSDIGRYSFTPSSMNDCKICGIRVLAREEKWGEM